MRLLHRRRPGPRAKTARPAAEPYLAAGAEEARRLGHNYVGTEHLLLVCVRDPDGGATRVLQQLNVPPQQVEEALARWLGASGPPGTSGPKIDPDALAALGIDFEAVRERLEATFGPGALEHAHASCLGICPRLKMALAYAVDYADGQPLTDEHILLGMLSVPDSVAARVLAELDVSLEAAEAIAGSHRE
jgi:ATP-dependent Clp protease ATP-binding subunit ClpA